MDPSLLYILGVFLDRKVNNFRIDYLSYQKHTMPRCGLSGATESGCRLLSAAGTMHLALSVLRGWSLIIVFGTMCQKL